MIKRHRKGAFLLLGYEIGVEPLIRCSSGRILALLPAYRTAEKSREDAKKLFHFSHTVQCKTGTSNPQVFDSNPARVL
jgi:hypothetical protein